MEIKENNKPIFKKVKMKCDMELNPKLNDYELTREFMNKFNTTVLCGRQGSGKTSLMVNLVRKLFKKCFHNIYVVMRETSRMSLDNNIFDKNLPEDQLYEDLTADVLEEIYEKVKINAKNGEYSLVIFDDQQDAMKDKLVVKILKKIVANQRHLHLVNLIILQNFQALDKSIRRIINNLIFFKMDKQQNEDIMTEVIPYKKELFDEIIKIGFDEAYSWIFINLNTGRTFKMWDEIILKQV